MGIVYIQPVKSTDQAAHAAVPGPEKPELMILSCAGGKPIESAPLRWLYFVVFC